MVDPDAFLAVCPSRPLMARIGDKWATLVIVALAGGPHRFGQLRRQLQGVSQKMLTQTLRNLERDGLVSRTLYDERPIRVEYQLTDLGHTLVPLVLGLKSWAEKNWKQVQKAHLKYDRHHHTS
ncbi:MAG: helix-turn-helix transcriptional regulator [Aquisalinus sp.]|nr:helix-turn-helix transcriptional regulator [Aquisalinus sp.]